jgi:C4-dicarboxylate-specific signal transduction histidine kinase
MPFNPFSQLTSKIFAGLLVLSLLTLGPGLWITRSKLAEARETIGQLQTWQREMIAAIQLAADNRDVDATTAKAQVQALGNARIELTGAIERQNAAIEAIQQQSEAAQALAREAEAKRRAAVRRAEDLQRELRRRAGAPVDPELIEQEVRRTQDLLYDEGL